LIGREEMAAKRKKLSSHILDAVAKKASEPQDSAFVWVTSTRM
jgi:hypothetical protein